MDHDFSLDDPLDPIVISLPAFEPPGFVLRVPARDVVRHTLLLGQTGSGKTSILNRILSDLIHYRADDDAARIGFLIVDFQGDDTVQKVRALAKKAGRLHDV